MYEFVVRYRKEHIRILTKVQMNVYYRKQTAMLLVLGLSLVGMAAVFSGHSKLAVALLALGCWLCISVHYPAQYLARQISRGMEDGKAEFHYRFTEGGIEISCGQDRNHVSYEKIQKIVDTREGFCFFLTRNAGFFISKSQFKTNDSCASFRHYIERQTGILIEQDAPVLLWLLRLRIQRKKQKGKI